MTSENKGKYSSKHPAETLCDPVIAAAVKEKADDGRIECEAAHALAAVLGKVPSEIGKTVDLMEYRITKCQMGLFGYSPQKKIVKAPADISPELREQLRRSAAAGRISCVSCWDIAQRLGIKKIEVSAACELLDLRIKPCQLGAF